MGYELHITRAEDWSDNEGHKIGAEEWLKVVEHDPELMLIDENGQYFAAWRGLSKHSEHWLDWSDGNINTKNPDRALVEKMIRLAKVLRAKVQGDDGEIYTENCALLDEIGKR